MMNLAVPREVHPGEVRVALIPEHVAKLVNSGAKVVITTTDLYDRAADV